MRTPLWVRGVTHTLTSVGSQCSCQELSSTSGHPCLISKSVPLATTSFVLFLVCMGKDMSDAPISPHSEERTQNCNLFYYTKIFLNISPLVIILPVRMIMPSLSIPKLQAFNLQNKQHKAKLSHCKLPASLCVHHLVRFTVSK